MSGLRMIGLTGGIASGKSTVTELLRSLGAQIIDADQVAREVVEPGRPALLEISARFPGAVKEDGTLDRAALGERVFKSEEDRKALNAIIHPRIHEAVAEKVAALMAAGHELVLYDAPLLIENRLHEGLSGVILVSAPRELQISRLMARNGFTREQAEARIESQLPLEEKRKHATWVIDNSGDLDGLRAQVEAVWRQIHG
ncbi:MAG: dephospho-CoA kinase [Myxococcaceae bacterium]